MRSRAAIAITAAAVIAAGAGVVVWRRSPPTVLQHGLCRQCNVLLITIDTLRSDRVGAFGSTRRLTPTLDGLAAEGLRLTRAYASAPLTLPSHTSILTAVSPPVHGVRANGLFRLGPTLPTLATVLSAAGYRTAAFVGAFVLDARFGLARGFELYDDRYGEKHAGDSTDGAERRAEEVLKPATTWILQSSDPQSAVRNRHWFAWVHLYDPHEPYRAPEPYASRYEPYDAEVAYADATLGRFMAELRSNHQLDQTLVVVVADHGESLGEHGERSHGVFAYEATLRVPWIMWAGARTGRQQWDGVSRLTDVAPSILDLIGVDAPAEFEGRSVVDAIAAGRRAAARPAYFEAMDANLTRNWAPLTGIISGHEKLIELPIPELYDVDADPQEKANLFSGAGERARTLQALLRAATTEFARRGSQSEQTNLSADARQRLQALGYVASSANPRTRTYTDADDPKSLIGPANELNRALADFNSGSREPSMATVRAIIRTHPEFATSYGVLASMQHDSGDLTGAIATLEDVVRRGIADQSVMVVLGAYLQEAGRLHDAAALLEAVVASHDDYADAHNSLGVVYSRMGLHDRAQAQFGKVLGLDPTSAAAYENLGVDALASGNLAAAHDDLTRALELDPNLARAHNALAGVLLRQRHPEDALAHWRRAVEIDPRLYDGLYNIGTVLWQSGQRAEARRYLERFVSDAPPERYQDDIARIRRMLNQ